MRVSLRVKGQRGRYPTHFVGRNRPSAFLSVVQRGRCTSYRHPYLPRRYGAPAVPPRQEIYGGILKFEAIYLLFDEPGDDGIAVLGAVTPVHHQLRRHLAVPDAVLVFLGGSEACKT